MQFQSNALFYPQIPRTVLDVSVLSDDELIQKIRSWGGTPKALTENKDMMKIAVRVLRADLTLLHNYRCGKRPLPLDLYSVHMVISMISFTEKRSKRLLEVSTSYITCKKKLDYLNFGQKECLKIKQANVLPVSVRGQFLSDG